MSAPRAVRAQGISKAFPGVVANAEVDFDARAGEVHALLGENGAGKSTLCNVLAGLYRPDAGTVELGGRHVEFDSPRDALDAGVGMVHQEFRLVQPFSVAENVVLGHPEVPFAAAPATLESRVAAAAGEFGLAIEASARVWQLGVGEQQRVEILKVLYRGATVLLLDEPTAVLTPHETDGLFTTLRAMIAGGRTVVLITHKLDEVMAVSDRVTVLRDGRTVGTAVTAETSKRELASMMVGREVLFQRVGRRAAASGGRSDATQASASSVPGLELEGVSASSDSGGAALRGVSLRVGRGEIVGVAGVAGNGQRELAEAIAGMRRRDAGDVRVAGTEVVNGNVRAAMDAGIAYVPEDRRHTGMAAGHSVEDNMVLKTYRRRPMSRLSLLRRKAIRANATRLVAENDVRTSSVTTPVRLLSGGNIQKAMLAREFATTPVALVAASPTRGLDVGATEAIRGRLAAAADTGVAVLLISEDLEELIAVADRIAVIYEGAIVGEVDGADADRESIGMLMGGSAEAFAADAVPAPTAQARTAQAQAAQAQESQDGTG